MARWKFSPLCPVMRSRNLTNTSIFSHANLGSGDLILLTCAAIKLELFLELTAVSVRLGSELFFSEQNPFCATVVCTALSTTKPCHGAEDSQGLPLQNWELQPKGRLGHKEGYGSSSEHISKHFINWHTLLCGPHSPQLIQLIHGKILRCMCPGGSSSGTALPQFLLY